mmetsp:Transcript_24578/g.36196  ORF Transcript_24578/g.36196 Transcript_24578/m.36196 type:complete len:443 (+) Transcript_24578:75-1403(+)
MSPLFLFLFFLYQGGYLEGCHGFEVSVSVSGDDDGEVEVKILEVLLFNQGELLSLSCLSSESSQSSACYDGSIETSCTLTPSLPLIISSNGHYFDRIVILSSEGRVYGSLVSVSAEGSVFWEDSIRDKSSMHVFDIETAAQLNYPVQIVSTFSYNGEPAAAFHVEYLYHTVSEFIIVESWYTISGELKPELYFQRDDNRKLFEPFMSKIRYVVIDSVPARPHDWVDPSHQWMREESYDAFWVDDYQRKAARNYVDPTSRTLVICTDSDEIPRREIVAQLRNVALYDLFRYTVPLQMYFFYYSFRWMSVDTWYHPFIINAQGYHELDNLIYARVHPPEEASRSIPNAGWHLSYFLSHEDVVRKVESFPHREFDRPEFKADDHVHDCLLNGADIYQRENFKLQAIDPYKHAAELPQGWEAFHSQILRKQGLREDKKSDYSSKMY